MELSVYLADLRHNYSGVLVTDGMPVGIGYMKAVIDRDLPGVESQLFTYPDHLLAALKQSPPDVLMLSNYMWNEFVSHHFAKIAKAIRPDTLVVMGGPNIYLEEERRIEYMRRHQDIDVYLLGEGDFLGRDLARLYLEKGKSKAQLLEGEIPSAMFRRPDGSIAHTTMWERKAEIEEIPSPWLTGVMDHFFDGKLAPMIETNRGCPFTCTFCVQGIRWYTKVHNFSKARIREELNYIGKRIYEVSPSVGNLIIADSNYGMFERDIELSGYIGEVQKNYGWPSYITATTGKNRPERIIQSLEKVNGAIVVYQAVQSMDDVTLRHVKRSNISKDAYETVMIHVRGRGLRSMSDLILGLPGETLKSHLQGIFDLIDAGTHEMHLFQAMMLKGSELEMVESRDKHHFQTRFRVLPKNWGVYDSKPCFDVDEITIATDTLSFEDYLEARRFALTFTVFWNNGWFEDVSAVVKSFGIKPSQFLQAMRHAMDADGGAVGKMLESFVAETRGELFPSYQALVDHYSIPENFQKLESGEVGDNLMYKYRALASFFHWREVCAVALNAAKALLVKKGAAAEMADFDAFWADFHRYVEQRHAHGTSAEEILPPAWSVLHYDIPAWMAANIPRDTSRFRLPQPQIFEFALQPEAARELDGFLKVWSTSLLGLSKGITRVRTKSLMRECRPATMVSAFAPTSSAQLSV